MRELMRSVAKGRMKALGMDRINRRMSHNQNQKENVVFGWRRVLTGDLAKRGAAAQRMNGLKAKRKLKKIKSIA